MSETYPMFKGMNCLDIQKTVVSELKNTISDRATVNKCVCEKLEDDLDTELLQLTCNVHPLDGAAIKTRNTLMEIEKDRGIKFR